MQLAVQRFKSSYLKFNKQKIIVGKAGSQVFYSDSEIHIPKNIKFIINGERIIFPTQTNITVKTEALKLISEVEIGNRRINVAKTGSNFVTISDKEIDIPISTKFYISDNRINFYKPIVVRVLNTTVLGGEDVGNTLSTNSD